MGRADVLCGVFYLLAFLCFVGSCDEEEKLLQLQDRPHEQLEQAESSIRSSSERRALMISGSSRIMVVARTRTQVRIKVKLWISMLSAVFALLSKEQGLTVFGVFMLYRLRILLKRRQTQSRDKW